MARRKLEPGEHSIDTVKATKEPSGNYVIQWSIRLHSGKLLPPRKTRGKTAGEARAKARAKAEELLLTSGNTGKFKSSSALTDYIEKVARNAVERADLRENTLRRYRTAITQLKEVFAGFTIHDGMRLRTIENALLVIRDKHGSESARQARNVLSKYVISQLIRDEILEHNPLAGIKIDLGSKIAKKKPTGGKGLDIEEYQRVLTWLLAENPAENISAPKRGRYTLKDAINIKRGAIDLTLLQMATGLRISEARTLKWTDVEDNGTTMIATVTPERSKTKRGRRIPVLEKSVAVHLRARRAEIGGSYVIGAPADANKEWERSNAQKAITKLLREIATECDIPLLNEVNSHVWRTTNNMLYAGKIPDSVRAAFFGHSTDVNRQYYTDTTDISLFLSANKD